MSDKLPAWLTAKVDQRLALVEESIGNADLATTSIVMTPLLEPHPTAPALTWARWDRTCDSCLVYCPDTEAFYTGHVVRALRNGTQVCITFGVCEICRSIKD
jgi:hypothetical protein